MDETSVALDQTMPNSVFYLVIVLAVGAYLLGVYRRKQALMADLPGGVRGVRYGPVPGYTFLPGSGIRWDSADPPMGLDQKWEPVSLETLHAGRRTRLILTVRADTGDSAERYSVMKALTARLQRRSGAAVVAVQIVGDRLGDRPEAVLIYAPDGRGWTGTTTDATITAELPDRKAFRMAM